jgi:ribosomal subunit interface protein
MDLMYTGRGVHVTDDMRDTALRKLAHLERLEPRLVRIDLEIISEHHPRPDGTKRIEAALAIPRRTFRAHAEAEDVLTALDRVVAKLDRQLRDHHGRKRARQQGRVESGTAPAEADEPAPDG